MLGIKGLTCSKVEIKLVRCYHKLDVLQQNVQIILIADKIYLIKIWLINNDELFG